MVEKIQYEDDKLKICAPDSLKFIVDDIVNYFYKQSFVILQNIHIRLRFLFYINGKRNPKRNRENSHKFFWRVF